VLYALSQLVDHMDFCYTVIGEGPDRVRLIELAANLRLQNRVRFLGRVSDEELLRCYRNSDLFILASKASQYDVEGFGIVYIEASASGVPVLGSRAGGACDAIEDGVNGVLIADSSPSAIAGGIKRFVATSELFPPSQVRAFANRFRWRSMARQLRALLSESCEQ
jgi:phosphatidylinositol alpha-1,6-mannosyltransferase